MQRADIQKLLDEAATRRLVHLYCRSIDRLDEATLGSIYADGAIERHGGYFGATKGFQAFAVSFIKNIEGASHYITQCVVDLRGDTSAKATNGNR